MMSTAPRPFRIIERFYKISCLVFISFEPISYYNGFGPLQS